MLVFYNTQRNIMETVTVNATALRQVLQALTGPTHLIRELQVIRGLPLSENDPVKTLMDDYNRAVRAFNTQIFKTQEEL